VKTKKNQENPLFFLENPILTDFSSEIQKIGHIHFRHTHFFLEFPQ
jgi:hypothetical protein